jgi:hypothetical protein
MNDSVNGLKGKTTQLLHVNLRKDVSKNAPKIHSTIHHSVPSLDKDKKIPVDYSQLSLSGAIKSSVSSKPVVVFQFDGILDKSPKGLQQSVPLNDFQQAVSKYIALQEYKMPKALSSLAN